MNTSNDDIYISKYDSNVIIQDYNSNKQKYITRPKITKYEMTRILSERTQQIQDGSPIFISNPEKFDNIYQIALEEIKQNKIPYWIERKIGNTTEMWKLDDLL
jgi:DNA-directed RNA polymerase subunit K/omega